MIRCMVLPFSFKRLKTIVFTRMESNWTKQFLRLSDGGYEPMKCLLKTQKLMQ